MSKAFRVIAVLLAGLFLWLLPQIAAEIGSGGPVQIAMDVVAFTGAILMIPLFIYYAIRGAEAADRLLARFGLHKSRPKPAADEAVTSTDLAP